MKFYLSIAALLVISSVEGHKINNRNIVKRMNEEGGNTLDDDLQNLMDKYENNEKK